MANSQATSDGSAAGGEVEVEELRSRVQELEAKLAARESRGEGR